MSSDRDVFAFNNSFARELGDFCVRWQPARWPQAQLVCLNDALAEELGAAPARLRADEGVSMLAGNTPFPGAEPVAQAYAGHQFGNFSPQLGDGRALLLGEVMDRQGQRRDIALKGSGKTPFSRGGDGKCALGPALREYLIGEAMHALGIPTTRALAVVATGDTVRRERPLPGAVLTRVAASHLRVGTFEFFAAHFGPTHVRRLADYTLARHYPGLADAPDRYLALLADIAERQAALVARWLGVGFIHGVMNTDNMALSGETIDYGPCAFMEAYHPAAVFSSIDTGGRYAYGNQAAIAGWNLARLAEALLPLIDANEERAIRAAQAVIAAFPERHAAHWLAVFRRKLGLDEAGDEEEDRRLAEDFLGLLERQQTDFTRAFQALTLTACGEAETLHTLLPDTTSRDAWLARWRTRRSAAAPAALQAMRLANPAIIPRNHQVEAALQAAGEHGDLRPFDRLLAALRAPFDLRPEDAEFAEPAPRGFTAGYRTFCGT